MPNNLLENLPADLTAYRDTYIQLFGEMPPLPDAKLTFSSSIDEETVRLSEKLRAHAFYSDVIDTKSTQLMLFGFLLIQGSPAAKHHAVAARRAGASWEELLKVAELASAVMSLGPINQGSSVLKELWQKESASNAHTSN